MSDGIVEFIEAQMAADESVATAAKPGQWTIDHSMTHGWRILDGPDSTIATLVAWSPGPVFSFSEDVSRSRATSDHIARHDPMQVLANVAAVREVIDLYKAAEAAVEASAGTILGGAAKVNLRAYGNVLRALAAAYRKRPGYKPEWRLP